MRSDYMDSSIQAWEAERPGLDLEPAAVIGRIRRASSLIEERIGALITVFGVRNPGDFDTLAVLRRQGAPFEMSPKELAARLLVTSAGLSGRLDRLEDAGWVQRTPHPEDRRSTIVALTADGVALVDEVYERMLELYDDALELVDTRRREELADLLRAILVNLEDA